jgi:uroporphyrinogen-III synthase
MNGEKEYRTDLYERTAERFGVGTKSGGIDAACQFSTQMLRNLKRAAECTQHCPVVWIGVRSDSLIRNPALGT